MGMYTSLVISARLKESTPSHVIEQIKAMAKGDLQSMAATGSKTMRNPMCGSSAYFPEGVALVQPDDYGGKGFTITSVGNIKDYEGEIDSLLIWLKPHIEQGHGSREWWAIVTYEESEPVIHYLEDA